jgi:hypothetical protein
LAFQTSKCWVNPRLTAQFVGGDSINRAVALYGYYGAAIGVNRVFAAFT